MRVAIYSRVSTTEQTTETQEIALRDACAIRGWTVVAEYSDPGISGAKGRDQRPGLDRALKAAVRREYDVLAAWSVDRLGRSLSDLLATLGELKGAGVALYLHQQAIDTSTPAGAMLFQMLGVFAEFERAIICERVRAGIARARARGVRLGREPLSPSMRARARDMLARGESPRTIADRLGCSVRTVYRVARAATCDTD